MGSIANAIRVGFVCRLCSRIKKVVIHLYTARAKQLDLLNKIKLLLPISVSWPLVTEPGPTVPNFTGGQIR